MRNTRIFCFLRFLDEFFFNPIPSFSFMLTIRADLLIIGCGDKIEQLPKATLEAFHNSETMLEVLDTVRFVSCVVVVVVVVLFHPALFRERSEVPSRWGLTQTLSHPNTRQTAKRNRHIQHSSSRGETSSRSNDPAFCVRV